MAEHHLTEERSPYDAHVIIRCTDCDDMVDCGGFHDGKSFDVVYQHMRLFKTLHAPGKPRFSPYGGEHHS